MSKYSFIEKERVVIEDAEIIFSNFSGRPGKFNKEGDKNFCVIIDDDEVAHELGNRGWNVRILRPRDEDDVPRHYIPVAINFRSFPNVPPAQVVLVSSKAKTNLTDDTICVLDGADIVSVDLTIRPRHWEDDKTGEDKIKAYLHDMYVRVAESRLAAKYADCENPSEVPWEDD